MKWFSFSSFHFHFVRLHNSFCNCCFPPLYPLNLPHISLTNLRTTHTHTHTHTKKQKKSNNSKMKNNLLITWIKNFLCFTSEYMWWVLLPLIIIKKILFFFFCCGYSYHSCVPALACVCMNVWELPPKLTLLCYRDTAWVPTWWKVFECII